MPNNLQSLRSLPRFWRTVRHLRREQVLGRAWNLVPRRPGPARPAPPLRLAEGAFRGPILRHGPIRRNETFRFLNRDGHVRTAADWEMSGQTALWLYNLHYFDWLRETAARGRPSEDGGWIDRWIADNPASRGTGWAPYPLSLRIVNWIVWLLTIGEATTTRIGSLAAQARHLERHVEYHLLGNHLFANAKALVFAGAFFSGDEADRWGALGLTLLRSELREQVLPDGGHFERSPMYHALILEDVLDLIGLARVYPSRLAEPIAAMDLNSAAERMLRWLDAMRHPDGEIAYFNDAAFGIAPQPAELFAYARARGVAAPAAEAEGRLRVLESSGYAVLRAAPFRCIFDCGRIGPDYIPGHAHADTLCFEMSVGADRLITNSGTSTYERGARREWERATRAHATVGVDGQDSAEVWAGFRVGRRPDVGPIVTGEEGAAAWVECHHDGYRHLKGAPRHRRRLAVAPDGVRVDDRLEGGGEHSVAGFLPIHLGVTVTPLDKRSFRLATPGGYTVEASIDGPVEVELGEGRFANGFGMTQPRPVVQWRWRGTLPLSVQTALRLAVD